MKRKLAAAALIGSVLAGGVYKATRPPPMIHPSSSVRFEAGKHPVPR